MNRKYTKASVLLVASAMIAAACGGDDGDSTATTAGGGDTPATTAGGGDAPATTAGGGGDAPATTAGGDDAPATTEAAAPTQEIDRDAIVRYSQFRVDSLDPIRQGVPCETSVLYPIFDTLVTIDGGGVPQPMLAESWELLDGNILQLKLRQDVTFHDGTPFNADAVVFNLDRVLNDPESNITAQLASVQGVTAVDEFTVDIQLESSAAAPTLASLGDRAGMMISPTAYAAAGSSAEFALNPVGAGPYRMESYVPRESGSIRRADNYWDPSAQNLAGVDFTEFTQDQLNALRAGDMDVVALAPLDLSVIEGDDNYNMITGPTTVMRVFIMNETMEPFDNLLVRQAIAHAIDRETIADIQLLGLGQASYQWVPEGNLAYDPTIAELYPYDPDRARELLAEAGYADGLKIESAIGSSSNTYIQTGELVQSQLAAVGIDMDLQLLDAAVVVPGLFSDGPNGSGTIPSSPLGGSATADPDSGFRNIFSATGSFNAGKNEPEGVIELLDQGAAANDPAERASFYQQANRLAVEGVWHGVPLFFDVAGTAAQNYVGGITEVASACFAPQNMFRTMYVTAGKVPTED